MIKTLKDFNFNNKKVLVRCDFNVPLSEEGEILNDFRIKQTIPSIQYLIDKGAKIILISHLGNPKGRDKKLSLKPVVEKLSEYLKKEVKMADDCLGKEVKKKVSELKEKEVLVLENVRFYEEEKNNDQEFAQSLSQLGEIYINDAFSVCHRKHASVVGLPAYLPSGMGLLLEKEINVLSKIAQDPVRPFVVIIGGVKIESKTNALKELLKTADHLLIGGKIAEAIISIQGICVGRPLPDKAIIEEIKKIELTSPKFHLPVDSLVSPNKEGDIYVREAALAKTRRDEFILDIGPETLKVYSKIIEEAKTIFWTGPMGYFENRLFEKGTKKITELIAKNKNAYKVAGGGDTIAAISKFGFLEAFDHISTGGSATLMFLGKENLPGIEALNA